MQETRLQEYWRVLKQVWWLGLNLLLVYFFEVRKHCAAPRSPSHTTHPVRRIDWMR
jgi:hypothetical protein